MPKIRINISVDEEVSGMLKELAKAWHTTVSQLVTNWTLERHKELKAWDRLDETLYVPGELELAVDGIRKKYGGGAISYGEAADHLARGEEA